MIDTHVRTYVQPIFNRAAHGLYRLGATPNQVTVAAFVVGLAPGFLVVAGQPAAAVALLWLSGLLDVLDGSLARITGSSSPWGTTMDIVFDRLVEMGVLLGLATAYPASQLPMLWLMAMIIFSMTVFLTVGALSEKQGIKSFYYQAGLLERTEGFVFLSAMILLPQYLVVLTWLFVLLEAFTGTQRMVEAHRILNEHGR